MAARIFFVSFVFGALTVVIASAAPDPARAQDDGYSFEDFMAEVEEGKKDQALCRDDEGGTSPQVRIDACTRLIEDAPYENDLVGTYYVNRAMAGGDPDQNCADVRKGIQVIEDSKSTIYGEDYLSAAGRLEESICD
ncbi:hypothetical protein A7A08_00069 [Methyloligella halotolerans]|uniref:Uncharacterized protein n=1 Tax=Methyloligella halotolerans TaxID=1177755 RepID=A0A1E2S1F2_9HYPH|nr:hypothetical protein [Methyloligella halotolerans]ODA68252.1 hypothetical protein A7A08_00069 [Methyloligella halotolerans]